MIIQTAEAGEPHLAIMMHEHTALSGQFARAFGNRRFNRSEPEDLVEYVVSHHDAGWAEFDRDPVTDAATGLPYNLVETPAEHITRTSRLSPDFNERHHPYCGLLSSMHSWGLYNGRYGLSNLVLIDRIPQNDRPLAERMLEGELARQNRLKSQLAAQPEWASGLEESRVFQNYKQLQFFDTLALYFNRVHAQARSAQEFTHVPIDPQEDTTIRVEPLKPGVYGLSPFPFSVDGAEFAFAGRMIQPNQQRQGGWGEVLRQSPTEWETFRLVSMQ
jgi:hypothetical protein